MSEEHVTYWTPIGGGKIRCRCWACSWEIEMDLDEATGRIKPWTDPQGRPKASGFSFQRVRFENEVEDAVAAGMTGAALEQVARKYTRRHHFCVNRKCNGRNDGSCGIKMGPMEIRPAGE